MNIWVDLANSPHVPFFRALIPEFVSRNHQVLVTARDYAQTVELAMAAHLTPVVIGAHGGGRLAGKAGNLIGRAAALAKWARGRNFDVAVSHNSYSHVAAARWLGISRVTLMDYEHQPANHLAFRLASKVIVPAAFPDSALRRFGASQKKVARYHGTKEDVYLADFVPDPSFTQTLCELGVSSHDVIVVVRPPANEALYHRFENKLFQELLKELGRRPNVKVIILSRSDAQKSQFQSVTQPNFIFPVTALDGANLVASSDLVISAGGTMNREAAALGIPAATIYGGQWAAIDQQLVAEGRLMRIGTHAELAALRIEKKPPAQPRRSTEVRKEVVDLILAQ